MQYDFKIVLHFIIVLKRVTSCNEKFFEPIMNCNRLKKSKKMSRLF